MQRPKIHSLLVTVALLAGLAWAQHSAKKDKYITLTPAATNSVIDSGTAGCISKWADISGAYLLGDANIFAEKLGKVGIGTIAQAIVSEKIQGNGMAIKTNAPHVEVSWQVTGGRSYATAKKFKFEVEEEKGEKARGYYLNPDAYGHPEEKSILYARGPEGQRQLKE